MQLLPSNHGIKVIIAHRLRQETTMELKWIAQQLAIGSWKYLSNLLNLERQTCEQGELAFMNNPDN